MSGRVAIAMSPALILWETDVFRKPRVIFIL